MIRMCIFVLWMVCSKICLVLGLSQRRSLRLFLKLKLMLRSPSMLLFYLSLGGWCSQVVPLDKCLIDYLLRYHLLARPVTRLLLLLPLSPLPMPCCVVPQGTLLANGMLSSHIWHSAGLRQKSDSSVACHCARSDGLGMLCPVC